MDFADMFEWWNGAAERNAMSAIMSNKQTWDHDEFFATGRASLEEHSLFARLAGVTIAGNSALDFGCGIGRVTNALADRYLEVTGVDISEEMIRQALANRSKTSIQFQQVRELPLPFEDESFDLVYSSLVVQHTYPLPYSLGYVDEFFRVARDVLYFDAPSHKLHPDDAEPNEGIFFLHRDLILNRAELHDFELLALRQFAGTAWRHQGNTYSSANRSLGRKHNRVDSVDADGLGSDAPSSAQTRRGRASPPKLVFATEERLAIRQRRQGGTRR